MDIYHQSYIEKPSINNIKTGGMRYMHYMYALHFKEHKTKHCYSRRNHISWSVHNLAVVVVGMTGKGQ